MITWTYCRASRSSCSSSLSLPGLRVSVMINRKLPAHARSPRTSFPGFAWIWSLLIPKTFGTARRHVLISPTPYKFKHYHYNDVTMSAMASQVTGVSIVCSTLGAGADQRKHQSSASLVTSEFPAQKASNEENVSI